MSTLKIRVMDEEREYLIISESVYGYLQYSKGIKGWIGCYANGHMKPLKYTKYRNTKEEARRELISIMGIEGTETESI